MTTCRETRWPGRPNLPLFQTDLVQGIWMNIPIFLLLYHFVCWLSQLAGKGPILFGRKVKAWSLGLTVLVMGSQEFGERFFNFSSSRKKLAESRNRSTLSWRRWRRLYHRPLLDLCCLLENSSRAAWQRARNFSRLEDFKKWSCKQAAVFWTLWHFDQNTL